MADKEKPRARNVEVELWKIRIVDSYLVRSNYNAELAFESFIFDKKLGEYHLAEERRLLSAYEFFFIATNRYEVGNSPEDRVFQKYERMGLERRSDDRNYVMYARGFQEGITFTLQTLGIHVNGIHYNDHLVNKN